MELKLYIKLCVCVCVCVCVGRGSDEDPTISKFSIMFVINTLRNYSDSRNVMHYHPLIVDLLRYSGKFSLVQIFTYLTKKPRE